MEMEWTASLRANNYHLANWYRESNLPGNWAIATSENSWTDNETDVGCFSVLKQAYGQEIERLIRCSITHVSKTKFFPAFYAAFQATMTERNIREGFRGAGIVPLDPEYIVSKLDVQLRTPTPVEEGAKYLIPWVSKTPKTVLKAQFQSEYLERRIRRHQSSSPESILEALKPFSKGTKAVMHEMALLYQLPALIICQFNQSNCRILPFNQINSCISKVEIIDILQMHHAIA
jgi:hypothetical protein